MLALPPHIHHLVILHSSFPHLKHTLTHSHTHSSHDSLTSHFPLLSLRLLTEGKCDVDPSNGHESNKASDRPILVPWRISGVRGLALGLHGYVCGVMVQERAGARTAGVTLWKLEAHGMPAACEAARLPRRDEVRTMNMMVKHV